MARATSFSKHRLALRALFASWAFVVALVATSFAPRLAFAFTPPTLLGPVSDHASVLSAQESARIEAKIRAFRQSTGHEVAVLTVPTLGGETVEDYAYRTAKAWSLGSEKNDDGVLLLVATSERKIRIETGKGVGGELTDVQSSHIIRDRIAPELKRGNYGAGIEAGVDAIVARLSGLPDAPPPPPIVKAPKRSGIQLFVPVFIGLVFGTVILSVVIGAIRRRRGGGAYSGYDGGSGGGSSDWASGAGAGFIAGSDWSSGSSGGSDWSSGSSGGSDWSSGSSGGDFGGGGGDFGGGGSSGDY